jgi:hypothetical protein
MNRIVDLILTTCSISVSWFVLLAAAHSAMGLDAGSRFYRDGMLFLAMFVGSGVLGGYLVTWRNSSPPPREDLP